MSRARTDCVIALLFAASTFRDVAEQLILFLPPRFQRPRENLLEMIAGIHGGLKENNVGAIFGSGYFVLQSGMTIDRQRHSFGRRRVLHFLQHPIARQLMMFFPKLDCRPQFSLR